MTMVYENELVHYNNGLELLEKQKFGAAKKQFELSLEDIGNQNSEISANAKFYIAKCALELFHKDAEFLLKQFIQQYPFSPRVQDAWFLLGSYNYRKKNWEETIEYFDHILLVNLKEPEKSEYLFKRGYSFFMMDSLEAAATELYQMTDEGSVYYAPGVYYFAHINYQQGKYATALKSFQRLEGHPQFGDVVPYYIVQIYYFLEDYDNLVAYGSPFLSQEEVKRKHEISRLIGEAFYAKEEWAEAVPFLEDYIKSPYQKEKTDYYQVGYAMVKSGRFDDGAAYLSKVSYADDSLAQNAQYVMGEAYLKAGKKAYARNAYRSASRLSFDPFIAEDALFKYAKISYELSYDPYEGAIEAFKEYTQTYPDAAHTKEAYDYLVNIYLTSKNYDAALSSIEEYDNPDFRLQEAYQRIAFNKGVNEFTENRYRSAIGYFDKALIYPQSKIIAAKAHFWRAESFYYLANYDEAATAYKNFLYAPGAIISGQFNLAHYNLGYAYFQQENYRQAPEWFRRFTSYKKETDQEKLADANLRIADCFFMAKNYVAAEEYYAKATEYDGADPDYALFQTAVTQGLLGNFDSKVSNLSKLISTYPESDYVDESYYEIGQAYQRLGDNEKALANYNKVIDKYKGSSYYRKSLVSSGQIYYNLRQNDKAEANFKRVIDEFPTYEDTREALLGLQSIYTERGDVAAYEQLLEGLSFVKISEMALDSINYEAAENQYFDGECSKAVQSFNRYLSKYEKGIFSLNARYYRGECLQKMNQDSVALQDFEHVANLPKNRFTETAALYAARINYSNDDYAEALAYYKRLAIVGEYPDNLLEAEIGQMRCYFELNSFQSAISNAYIVLENKKIGSSLRNECWMIIARANLEMKDADQAVPYLKKLVEGGSPSQAAESMYYLARFDFNRDSLDRAEERVFKLVENYQSESYWLAKGLILLSEVYTTRGDLFQAKATLKSILENYENETDDVKKLAKRKLETLVEIEKQEKTIKEPEMEIYFDPADSTQINKIEEKE